MQHHKLRLLGVFFTLFLAGCATSIPTSQTPENCLETNQTSALCPPVGAIQDDALEKLHNERRFEFAKELPINLIEFARDNKAPNNKANMKFIGSTDQDSINALAARLWMIENAEHTIDLVYYIFRNDLAGQAILGALCNAVKRGVDIRIAVDSLGSVSFRKKHLRTLENCAETAGYMKNANGETTIFRARVQAVVFNAISKFSRKLNRRSHDKLLLVDGSFPEKMASITGGRNISLDYYGILEDGSPNPESYRDADILLRSTKADDVSDYPLGKVIEAYFTILFTYKHNLPLQARNTSYAQKIYASGQTKYQESLKQLKALPKIKNSLSQMNVFMQQDFHEGDAVLTHELANLINKNVVNKAVSNFTNSPNSIIGIMNRGGLGNNKLIRLVSPYLFSAKFNSKKNGFLDEAKDMLEWLEAHPDSVIEIVTNSVLTSDNPFTQSVIDMDFAPRLLLNKEFQKKWVNSQKKGEQNKALVESDDWIKMINHPRMRIYETGQLNDVAFGGNYRHSKLHAKYITADDTGYVGTSNFDYRSRLYNNEMGFFFKSKELAEQINQNTDYLISLSYRWGSPKWLEMRQRLRKKKGSKAFLINNQRSVYKLLKGTGLIWLF